MYNNQKIRKKYIIVIFFGICGSEFSPEKRSIFWKLGMKIKNNKMKKIYNSPTEVAP